MELQGVYPQIKEVGGEVVGISSDPPSTVRGTVKGWRVDFPLLPDPEKKVIRTYKAYHPGYDLAHPTVYILDRAGKIGWVHRSATYVERPPAERVLKEVRRLAAGGP